MAQTPIRALEGTIQSLLQGVSQQVPRERQPGQLGAQLNMLSDPVSGIRRRPPGEIVWESTIDTPGLDSLFTEYVERGTDGRHLLINTSNGNWWLLAKNGKTILNSGNDDNNSNPGFVENGYITGIAAFQGRLVLLSGSVVDMSASGLYQRFYRSTVTSLLDTDRISISSASAQDSVYRTAVQFNRDLVLFANSMQAVVPGRIRCSGA
jgi:hypothetical protein